MLTASLLSKYNKNRSNVKLTVKAILVKMEKIRKLKIETKNEEN